MNVFKYAVSTLVVAGAVVAVAPAAEAVTPATSTNPNTTNACDIPKLKLGEATGKNMTVSNGKVTATFQVSGTNCTTPVTLAVWKTPSKSGQPINDQEFFGHTTITVGPGTQTITASVPDCYFQADLLVGSDAKAADDTANYSFQNGKIVESGLRDWLYGGDKKCEKPKTPEPPVTPQQPQPPTGGQGGQVLAAQTPEALPVTGPAAVAGTFAGVSASAGLAHGVVRRLRLRK